MQSVHELDPVHFGYERQIHFFLRDDAPHTLHYDILETSCGRQTLSHGSIEYAGSVEEACDAVIQQYKSDRPVVFGR